MFKPRHFSATFEIEILYIKNHLIRIDTARQIQQADFAQTEVCSTQVGYTFNPIDHGRFVGRHFKVL